MSWWQWIFVFHNASYLVSQNMFTITHHFYNTEFLNGILPAEKLHHYLLSWQTKLDFYGTKYDLLQPEMLLLSAQQKVLSATQLHIENLWKTIIMNYKVALWLSVLETFPPSLGSYVHELSAGRFLWDLSTSSSHKFHSTIQFLYCCISTWTEWWNVVTGLVNWHPTLV